MARVYYLLFALAIGSADLSIDEHNNEEYPEDASDFLRCAAYHYNDAFVEEYFYKLINLPNIEQYQIRKLFVRKKFLYDDDWKWLKNNFIDSILYVAAKRNYEFSDEECLRICNAMLENRRQESNEQNLGFYFNEDDTNLMYWCLAKLCKWSVIKELLTSSNNKLNIAGPKLVVN